jgi:hypothetical protein
VGNSSGSIPAIADLMCAAVPPAVTGGEASAPKTQENPAVGFRELLDALRLDGGMQLAPEQALASSETAEVEAGAPASAGPTMFASGHAKARIEPRTEGADPSDSNRDCQENTVEIPFFASSPLPISWMRVPDGGAQESLPELIDSADPGGLSAPESASASTPESGAESAVPKAVTPFVAVGPIVTRAQPAGLAPVFGLRTQGAPTAAGQDDSVIVKGGERAAAPVPLTQGSLNMPGLIGHGQRTVPPVASMVDSVVPRPPDVLTNTRQVLPSDSHDDGAPALDEKWNSTPLPLDTGSPLPTGRNSPKSTDDAGPIANTPAGTVSITILRQETQARMEAPLPARSGGCEVEDAPRPTPIGEITRETPDQSRPVVALPESAKGPDSAGSLSKVRPAGKDDRDSKTLTVTQRAPAEEQGALGLREPVSAKPVSALAAPSRDSSSRPERPAAFKPAAQPHDTGFRAIFAAGDATGPKAAAVAHATQSAAPRQADLMQQLTDRIQSQIQSGGTEIRIQLKPEMLGRIEIRAENGAAGVTARIATESSEVRQYLEGNLHILQQNLQDQGMRVDRIEVVVQPHLDTRSSSGQQPSGHAGNGGNERGESGGSASPADAPGLHEELHVDAGTLLALSPNSTFHTVA